MAIDWRSVFLKKVVTLHQLASLKANQGEVDAAIQLFEESIAIERSIGHLPGLPPTLNWVASILEKQGNLSKALAYREEALQIQEKIKDPNVERVRAIVADLKRLLGQA